MEDDGGWALGGRGKEIGAGSSKYGSGADILRPAGWFESVTVDKRAVKAGRVLESA